MGYLTSNQENQDDSSILKLINLKILSIDTLESKLVLYTLNLHSIRVNHSFEFIQFEHPAKVAYFKNL